MKLGAYADVERALVGFLGALALLRAEGKVVVNHLMEGPFNVGSRFGLEINAVPQYPLQVSTSLMR